MGRVPGPGGRFHNAVFRAYFVDGKNIYATETLARRRTPSDCGARTSMRSCATGPSRRPSIRTGCAPESCSSRRSRPSA